MGEAVLIVNYDSSGQVIERGPSEKNREIHDPSSSVPAHLSKNKCSVEHSESHPL